MFTSDADIAPTTADSWGTQIVDLAADTTPGVDLGNVGDTAARFVLVLLREAGRGLAVPRHSSRTGAASVR